MHQGCEIYMMQKCNQNFLNLFYDSSYSTEAMETLRVWVRTDLDTLYLHGSRTLPIPTKASSEVEATAASTPVQI